MSDEIVTTEPERSREALDSFTRYCEDHPQERFWQALRNWSGYDRILAQKGEFARTKEVFDTFAWEGIERLNIPEQPFP